jgi:hypothetical protein
LFTPHGGDGDGGGTFPANSTLAAAGEHQPESNLKVVLNQPFFHDWREEM